jgi:hypothetical protein
LGAGDLGPNLLDLARPELLVQRQAYGLDGDVGAAGLLQKRAARRPTASALAICAGSPQKRGDAGTRNAPKDAGGDIATAADGDDKVWSEGVENLGSRSLTQLVDLSRREHRRG